jgi:hypothetical protein
MKQENPRPAAVRQPGKFEPPQGDGKMGAAGSSHAAKAVPVGQARPGFSALDRSGAPRNPEFKRLWENSGRDIHKTIDGRPRVSSESPGSPPEGPGSAHHGAVLEIAPDATTIESPRRRGSSEDPQAADTCRGFDS